MTAAETQHRYPGETIGAHTFPPHTFPADARGVVRIICLCGGATVNRHINELPTISAEEPTP